MSSEWVEYTVADVAAQVKNALVGGPFGSNLVSKDYVETGVPVIRGQNMGDGRWVTGGFAHVSGDKADSLSANTARPGDLVFTQRGTLGQVAIVPEGPYEKYIVSQSQMKLTVDKEKADTLFLYYLFTSPEQQRYIKTNAIQVGVPHTNLGILRDTPIYLPKLPVQREIAKVLSSIDDKIELNREINKTLENIAQAIFKSWFVDFEPVKAKIQAKQNGQDPERAAMCAISGRSDAELGAFLEASTPEQRQQLTATAALFPDELEDAAQGSANVAGGRMPGATSDLGSIPKGWVVGKFGDIALNVRDGVDPTNEEPDTPYIGLEHIERKHIYVTNWGSAGQVESNKSRFQAGDILFGKLRPYFHKVCFMPFDGICSTDILAIRPKNSDWTGFVQFQLFNERFVDYANLRSTGTRMPRANWKDMSNYPVVLPSQGLASVFNVLVRQFNNHAANSIENSKVLTSLRDALLPKLLSGKINLGDTQSKAEAVA